MMRSSLPKEVPMLLYEDTPQYDFWLKALLIGIIAFTLIGGLILLPEDPTDALIMLGAVVFYALLFKAILPQRFQVFQDRVKIVLGGPFAITFYLSNIREVRPVSGSKALFYGGVRFATSTRGVVEIVPKKGLSVVFSPAHPDMFLEHLNRAMTQYPA
ncbi:MAG: hypothetical protein ABIH70_01135 [Chloroflexota bacterium]